MKKESRLEEGLLGDYEKSCIFWEYSCEYDEYGAKSEELEDKLSFSISIEKKGGFKIYPNANGYFWGYNKKTHFNFLTIEQINCLFNLVIPGAIKKLEIDLQNQLSEMQYKINNHENLQEIMNKFQDTVVASYPFPVESKNNLNAPVIEQIAYVIRAATRLPDSQAKKQLLERARVLFETAKTQPTIKQMAGESVRLEKLHRVLDAAAGEVEAVKELRQQNGIIKIQE